MSTKSNLNHALHKRIKPKESKGGMGERDYPDIWRAVRKNDLPLVKSILEKNPEMLNAQEYESELTPLHIAAVQRNWEISEFLLEHVEIDGWIEDCHGRPIMALAYATRDKLFIELFRRHILPKDLIGPLVGVAPDLD